MSANLVGMIMDQLGDRALGQLSDSLGESRDNTQMAAKAAVPGLLGSLVKMASSKDEARGLLSVLNSADESVVDGFASSLGKNRAALENKGGSMLESLMGGNLGNLAGAVSGYSNLNKNSTRSLLSLLAPMVIGMLKRNLMKSGGLNIENLMGTLMGQKSHIAAAMPSGFQNQLQSSGLNALADFAKGAGATASTVRQGATTAATTAVRDTATAARGTADAARDTAAAGGNATRRFLVPALIVAAAAVLLFNLFGNRGAQTVQDAARNTAGTVEAATDAAGDAANNAANNAAGAASDTANAAAGAATNAAESAGNAVQNAFSGLSGLAVGDVNVGERLTDTFANTTEALNNVTDEASAEAALPTLEEAASNLEGLAETAQQLPEAGLSAVSEAAGSAMSQVQSLIDQAYAIPGVEGILEPVISRLMEAITALTA